MADPAIFLDRDGTINVEKNYLHKIVDWEWLPGSLNAIRAFNNAGFKVVVVSNQAGIARGFYSTVDVDQLHRRVDKMLAAHGAHINRYYYCPHHPEYGIDRDCTCRKPQPGMLYQAQQELNIDLARSWMIGDKHIDILAGQTAGAQTVLVKTGYGTAELALCDPGMRVAENLAAAARLILAIS